MPADGDEGWLNRFVVAAVPEVSLTKRRKQPVKRKCFKIPITHKSVELLANSRPVVDDKGEMFRPRLMNDP